MYVIKKYIWAVSALDAIRQEKDYSVDECGLDIAWRDYFLSEQMGFDDPLDFKDE
jgi:hypothetical protein